MRASRATRKAPATPQTKNATPGAIVSERTKAVPRNHWDSLPNRRELFDKIAEIQGINGDLAGWYSLKPSAVKKLGAKTLIDNYYNGSLRNALKDCYPEHHWRDEKFPRHARNSWASLAHQRAFIEASIAPALNIKSLDDWYRVTLGEVREALAQAQKVNNSAANKLIWRYSAQLYSLLKAVYPQHPWRGWMFTKVPRNYWESMGLDEAKDYIRHLETKLGLRQPEDWYRVSHGLIKQSQIKTPRSKGTKSATWAEGPMSALLKRVYPEHEWDFSQFQVRDKRTEQLVLGAKLHTVFPQETIEKEATIGRGVPRGSVRARPVTVDLLIPRLKLAFEYQGRQHFQGLYANQQGLQAKLDQLKRRICQEDDLTLIEIPYTWSGEVEELKAIIAKKRPDLGLG